MPLAFVAVHGTIMELMNQSINQNLKRARSVVRFEATEFSVTSGTSQANVFKYLIDSLICLFQLN